MSKKMAWAKKNCLKNVFLKIRYDTQSVTSNNLRKILLLLDKDDIDELTPHDAKNIVYAPLPSEDEWRIGFAKEITDIKFGRMSLEGFSTEELNDLLRYVCIS